jgi:hypothetical protein
MGDALYLAFKKQAQTLPSTHCLTQDPSAFGALSVTNSADSSGAAG